MQAVPQQRTTAERKKLSRSSVGLLGMERENGYVMSPKYMAVFPSQAAWKVR
jgi:hypothetical protein